MNDIAVVLEDKLRYLRYDAFGVGQERSRTAVVGFGGSKWPKFYSLSVSLRLPSPRESVFASFRKGLSADFIIHAARDFFQPVWSCVASIARFSTSSSGMPTSI
jgi:hypothetical protein